MSSTGVSSPPGTDVGAEVGALRRSASPEQVRDELIDAAEGNEDDGLSPEEAQINEAIDDTANPLAGEKLTKKLLKLVKNAATAKSLRRGVKEVQKALRKGETGLMVLAGNITPIDVITHLPVLCEDKDIPYIYVPYKEDLGEAGGTKRPTSVILVLLKAGSDFKDAYDEAVTAVKAAYPASFK